MHVFLTLTGQLFQKNAKFYSTATYIGEYVHESKTFAFQFLFYAINGLQNHRQLEFDQEVLPRLRGEKVNNATQ